MDKNYQLALLYFVHLLVSADGVTDIDELNAWSKIQQEENFSDSIIHEFEEIKNSKTEREIYQTALDYLTPCTDLEKLKVFATLYKLSEVDGRVHPKEIRLLLYSLKGAGIEFDDVVNYVKANSFMF